jgi:hypothetical protein
MRILQGESTKPPPRSSTATPRVMAIWTVVVVLGFTLAVVGWTSAVMQWISVDLADPAMVVTAISGHFAALALPTIGLGAMAVGSMGRGNRKIVRGIALTFLALAGINGTATLVYLTRLPNALVDPVVAVRTLIFAFMYTLAYAWTSYYLWSETRVRAWP